MSISTNKTPSYPKDPPPKLTSLKLFPKKLSTSKLHNLKLKKDTELTFTRENIKNLFGNKLTTTITTTTKNSPNSSLYISQTTNNIEFSFSNNINNTTTTNNISHSPIDLDPLNNFNFTFQNDFTYSDISDSILQLESQHIKNKQTFNTNITTIEHYLHLLEQVIALIRNYDEIKEHILLDKIHNGLKEHCMLIKGKYMKLNKKYHLQSKEINECKEYMRKLKESVINNNTNNNDRSGKGINFIDNINIFEDNSVHYKERDVELESLYFKDKVRMKKNRSLKNINVPKLDLSFNQMGMGMGKEGKGNKDKKGGLNKSLYVKNINGNNNCNMYINNNNNQIQRNIVCFKMVAQNKHRPKSKSFSMFSPINIEHTSTINNMNH